MGLLEKIAAQLKRPDEGVFGKFVVGAMACATTVANDWTISLMDIQSADHVLEVGFGPGITIQHVAGIVSEGFVAGIDFSKVMVRQAQKRNSAAIQAQPLESVQELRRVLKPGGILAITVWAEDEFSMKRMAQAGLYTVYTVEDLSCIFKGAGFSDVCCKTKAFMHASAICALGVK